MSIPVSSFVTETISLASPGIGAQGFGTPLIYSNTGNAWASPELARTYDVSVDLTGVAADFASTTPEYQAAAALAAQGALKTLLIGKGSHLPTMIKTLTLQSAAAAVKYLINLYNGGNLWSAAYTSIAPAVWVALTPYPKGYVLTADTGKLYICITAGTSSAASPPTGTAPSIPDGTVAWMYISSAATNTLNDAIAYQIVNMITPAAWVTLMPYLVGDRVTVSGNIFQCTVAGTAGAVGPSGTGAQALDGTVQWVFVVATPNFVATLTGSVMSKGITLTGSAAGNWFAVEPIASGDPSAVSNLMALVDTTLLPAGLTSDLDAILNANNTWYALIPLFKGNAILATASTGIGAWCQSNKRFLLAAVSDTACATAALAAATDTLANLVGVARKYVAPQWHPRDYEWLDASTLGWFLPIAPGGDNWRLKALVGPTPVNLTATQQANLDARRAGYFVTVTAAMGGGQNLLCGGGYVEDPTYGFIDNVRNIDSHTINEQVKLFNLLVSNGKIANTNAGRALFVNAMAAQIEADIAAGIISRDPLNPTGSPPVIAPYTITMPAVSDASSFNLTTRALSGVSERWKLAGAINSLAVTVYVQQ